MTSSQYFGIVPPRSLRSATCRCLEGYVDPRDKGFYGLPHRKSLGASKSFLRDVAASGLSASHLRAQEAEANLEVIKLTVRRLAISSQTSCCNTTRHATVFRYTIDQQEQHPVAIMDLPYYDGLQCKSAMQAENVMLRDGIRCVISTLGPYDVSQHQRFCRGEQAVLGADRPNCCHSSSRQE